MSATWYEVWVDVSPQYPYLLLVQGAIDGTGRIVVRDPAEGYSVVHTADSYEAACLWLGEDEFELHGERVTEPG